MTLFSLPSLPWKEVTVWPRAISIPFHEGFLDLAAKFRIQIFVQNAVGTINQGNLLAVLLEGFNQFHADITGADNRNVLPALFNDRIE